MVAEDVASVSYVGANAAANRTVGYSGKAEVVSLVAELSAADGTFVVVSYLAYFVVGSDVVADTLSGLLVATFYFGSYAVVELFAAGVNVAANYSAGLLVAVIVG